MNPLHSPDQEVASPGSRQYPLRGADDPRRYSASQREREAATGRPPQPDEFESVREDLAIDLTDPRLRAEERRRIQEILESLQPTDVVVFDDVAKGWFSYHAPSTLDGCRHYSSISPTSSEWTRRFYASLRGERDESVST